MDFDESAFLDELDDLARGLPSGADFEHDLFAGNLRIVGLYLPETNTGAGRRFRERLLALADRYGLTTSMQPDETGEPHHPTTFELVRYYARFGYEIDHIDRDAFMVEMIRHPRPVRDGLVSIQADYASGKENDLTIEEFEALKGTISKYAYDTAPSASVRVPGLALN